MSENPNRDIIEAIKETGATTARAIDKLAGAVAKSSADATEHAFETQSAIREMRVVQGSMPSSSKDEGNGNKGTLFGLAGIMFGVMAPLYIFVFGITSTVTGLDSRMHEDNTRERADAEKFAGLQGQLTEVETQFENVVERLDSLSNGVGALAVRDVSDIRSLARLEYEVEHRSRTELLDALVGLLVTSPAGL